MERAMTNRNLRLSALFLSMAGLTAVGLSNTQRPDGGSTQETITAGAETPLSGSFPGFDPGQSLFSVTIASPPGFTLMLPYDCATEASPNPNAFAQGSMVVAITGASGDLVFMPAKEPPYPGVPNFLPLTEAFLTKNVRIVAAENPDGHTGPKFSGEMTVLFDLHPASSDEIANKGAEAGSTFLAVLGGLTESCEAALERQFNDPAHVQRARALSLAQLSAYKLKNFGLGERLSAPSAGGNQLPKREFSIVAAGQEGLSVPVARDRQEGKYIISPTAPTDGITAPLLPKNVLVLDLKTIQTAQGPDGVLRGEAKAFLANGWYGALAQGQVAAGAVAAGGRLDEDVGVIGQIETLSFDGGNFCLMATPVFYKSPASAAPTMTKITQAQQTAPAPPEIN
jgi:hypothetical protein